MATKQPFPARFKYQFYDGKAFHPGPGEDYSDRREKMAEELAIAYDYIQNGAATEGTLDNQLINKLISLIEQSYNKEKRLYDALELKNIPTISISKDDDLAKLNKYLLDLKDLSKRVTESFNPPDSNITKLLNLLNDADFLEYIAGKTTSMHYSYHDPEQGREYGKTVYTKALNRAMNLQTRKEQKQGSMSITNINHSYNDVYRLIEKDIDKVLGAYERDSAPYNEILQEVDKFIEESISEITNPKLKTRSEDRAPRVLTNEQKVKRFYKVLYYKLIDRFNQIIKEENGSLLNGTLFLYPEFLEKEDNGISYSSGVLFHIYQAGEGEEDLQKSLKHRTAVRQELNKKELIDIFINWLIKAIDEYRKGPVQLNLNEIPKEEIKASVEIAYDNLNNKQFFDEIALFSKSGVSGLLGEMASVISLHVPDARLTPVIVSSKHNKLKEKIAVDVNLYIAKDTKTEEVLGIQVKNYTSSNKSVKLYDGGEGIGLGETAMSNYLSTYDLKVFRFIVANMKIAKKLNVQINKDDLLSFLNLQVNSFLRMQTYTAPEYSNQFYYINNQIYSTSYLLMDILVKCLDVMKEAKKNSLFEITGKALDNKETTNDMKMRKIFIINPWVQPRADVKKDGKLIAGRRARGGFINGTDIYPAEAANVLDSVKIKFKGISVKILD